MDQNDLCWYFPGLAEGGAAVTWSPYGSAPSLRATFSNLW